MDLLSPHLPWWQLVVRGSVVYAAAYILLRIGKRRAGQLSPFDLVVLMLFGAIAGRVTLGEDVSVPAGIIVVFTLCILDSIGAWLASRSKRLERMLDGLPSVLIRDGVIYEQELERNRVSREQLMNALRSAGCANILDVHYAVLETNGHITVGVWHRKESWKQRLKLSVPDQPVPKRQSGYGKSL